MFTSLCHSEILWTPCTVFQCSHLGIFMSFAMHLDTKFDYLIDGASVKCFE